MQNKEIQNQSDLEIEFDNTNSMIMELLKTDSKKAIEETIKYLFAAKENMLKTHIVYANYLMAFQYLNLGKYQEAITYYNDCILVLDDTSNEMYAKAITGLGVAYKQLGNFKKALSYYYTALEKNDPEQMSAILNNISIVYRDLNDIDKAIEYSNKAYEFTSSNEDIISSLTILSNIGNYKLIQKKYDEAEEILLKTKEIAISHNITNQIINFDYKLSLLYFEKNEYSKSLSILENILDASIKNNYQLQIFNIKILLAQVKFKLNRADEAITLYKDLLLEKPEENLYNTSLVLTNYIKLTETVGNFEEGFYLQNQLMSIKELIYKKENDTNISNSKLMIDNKEQEMELLRLKDVNALNKQLEAKSILLEEKHLKLEETNNDLMHFSYALSHDLKEPVRMIKSFSDMLYMILSSKLNEEEKNMFFYIKNGAQKASVMIDELQKYAKLGVSDDMKKEIDLNTILSETILLLKKNIDESKAEINITKLPIVFSYPMFFNQLFQNIISNAIKYRQESIHPIISIEYELVDNEHQIKFIDNGIGIPLREQENVFVLFKRASNHKISDGTGVGLAFCSKIMSKLRGSISLISPGENLGSTILVSFPK